MTHVRIWKFRPPAGCHAEFALAYGADGVWSALFGRARGYLGTTLFRPGEPGGWWLTIDRWSSAADFEAFGSAHGDAYRALDIELEALAEEEEFVGAFDEAE
ncbi:MAG: antibiotic biosynthesis monooxygenase family protein [Sphingomicrobium sp.]